MELNKQVLNDTLSESEVKVLLLLRQLKPYEKIEIKLNDNKYGELSVVTTCVIKEIMRR